MQFFVGVLHRREPQRAMLLLQLRHNATGKNSSKRFDLQPRSQPARLASSAAVRPEPASRNGLSLAHHDGRRATVMGSSFPTCFFNASQRLSSGPFGLRLVATPGCPGVGDLNAACPLPRFQSFDPGLASSPLPLRGFRPLRITAISDLLPGSSPSETAPSPAAPRSRYACCGSSPRARNCFVSWLFLKSLGTDSILRPPGIKSQSDLK